MEYNDEAGIFYKLKEHFSRGFNCIFKHTFQSIGHFLTWSCCKKLFSAEGRISTSLVRKICKRVSSAEFGENVLNKDCFYIYHSSMECIFKDNQ